MRSSGTSSQWRAGDQDPRTIKFNPACKERTHDPSIVRRPAARNRRLLRSCSTAGLQKSLLLFETVVNAVHKAAPNAAIAFNTRPEDTADAAARWLKSD